MKKFAALFLLVCFLNASGAFAIEEIIPGKSQQTQTAQTAAKNTEKKKITKKDPGIIKLPNTEEIDEKAFKAKMEADEKEYKKIKALAGSGYLFLRDEDGKIRAEFTQGELTEAEQEFNKTRESWIEGYYIFYKTADRLIRANNLDTQNWRFEIDKKSDSFNAYANAANHVVIYSSAVDTFYDNEDALAFLLGHEISHHIFNHMREGAEARERIARLDIRIQNAIIFGIATAGISCLFVPVFLFRKHVWYKRLRAQETQADLEAVTLMARAGYNTEAANDVLSVMARLPELKFHYMEESHPKTIDRIAAVNRQTALIDIEKLQKEGAVNLYEKPVLKMKRSSDKKSIVLVPKKGKGVIYYQPVTEQQKVIYKAYSEYLKDDFTTPAELFEKAYYLDKKNYIPCLYLSYIYEYNYKKTQDKKALKTAKKWAQRAYKKHADKNTIKQKLDIEAEYAAVK